MLHKFDESNLVGISEFVNMACKISDKYPFVLISDFLQDLVNQTPNRIILEKYHLYDYNDLKSITDALKISKQAWSGKKYKMQNPDYKKQYEYLVSNVTIFNDPFVEMWHYVILRSMVVDLMTNSGYLVISDINDKIINNCQEIYNSNKIRWYDKQRSALFDKYLQSNLNQKIHCIINEMKEIKNIACDKNDISAPDYSTIKKSLYDILEKETGVISPASLQRKLVKKFPLLAMSDGDIFKKIIKELNDAKMIKSSLGNWGSVYFFTTNNYQINIEQINKQSIINGETKFFGRRITPTKFIESLQDDDVSDQAARRIAGIFLSNGISLKDLTTPTNKFDFAIDIKENKLAPKCNNVLKKHNIRIFSDTINCVIMINDIVTEQTILDIQNAAVTSNEGQVLIFTCLGVDLNAQKHLEYDNSIQIIDKETILDLVSIKKVVPCRLESFAMVRYGDYFNRLVQVKSLNYESMYATVRLVTESAVEQNIPMGSIEELLLLDVENPLSFKSAISKYSEFLGLLASISPDIFEGGLATHIKNIIMYNRKRWDVEFENVSVTLDMTDKTFLCTCLNRVNYDYPTLCIHQIAAINSMAMHTIELGPSGVKSFSILLSYLEQFRRESILSMIHHMYIHGDTDLQKAFKKYLKARMVA